jgi:hypothetical protein
MFIQDSKLREKWLEHLVGFWTGYTQGAGNKSIGLLAARNASKFEKANLLTP